MRKGGTIYFHGHEEEFSMQRLVVVSCDGLGHSKNVPRWKSIKIKIL